MQRHHFPCPSAASLPHVAGPVGVLNRVSQDVDMVTVRFNYRFGGYGGRVVARY